MTLSTLSNEDFQQLRDDLRLGAEDAVRRVVDRYGDLVLKIIRRRMNERIRPVVDSIDFQQDVWASLFTNRERLAEFEDQAALTRFLVRMAKTKVIQHYRRTHAAKREAAMIADWDEDRSPAPTPTPSQNAMSREHVQQVVSRLEPLDQRIVLLMLQGARYEQIGEILDLAPRTVRRRVTTLARLGSRLWERE